MIKSAYDISLLHKPADRTATDNQGWVFGLPPGIRPEQWPLDPISGYPLMHGFTLLLPEDYRCHGPEIVALSFFATAADQADGGHQPIKEMEEAVLGDAMPEDPRYRPFWRAPEQRHPRLHRMTDVLDYHYAVILLTRTEFDGAFCQPPLLPRNDLPMDAEQRRVSGIENEHGEIEWVYRQVYPKPEWLIKGAARATFESVNGNGDPETWVARQIGAPETGLAVNRAIRFTAYEKDPNAGKAPREDWNADTAPPEQAGYQIPFYFENDVLDAEHYREHEWAKDRAADHIGGTMRPVQALPEFSPYYIEFEEYFGGYNFGGGNAQLDFKDMKFDWACG